MRAVGFVLVLVLVLVLVARADEPAVAATAQPRVGELNPIVLDILRSIPADGTHKYWWPKGDESGYSGTTRDLFYLGQKVCQGDAEGRTYCCGLTFEVFFRAWEAWQARKRSPFKIGDQGAPGVKKIKSDWFCAGEVRDGPISALVPRGLGVRIERLEDAKPGDFVQLWRKKGSGHSVVFIEWVREKGEIAALKYWSTQQASNGVGYRVERLDGDNALVREKIFIARAGVSQ